MREQGIKEEKMSEKDGEKERNGAEKRKVRRRALGRIKRLGERSLGEGGKKLYDIILEGCDEG